MVPTFVAQALGLWLALSAGAPAPGPATTPSQAPAPVTSACPVTISGMACIPQAHFTRGTNETHKCLQEENVTHKTKFGPAIEVDVDAFYMDVTEVTIEAYGECVKQKKCPKDGPRYNDFSRPNQPITALSWFNAKTFCEAQGKRLPTEVEWERAARGDDPAFDSTVPTCPDVIVLDTRLGEEKGRSCGTPKANPHPEKGRVLEVKSGPPGPFGLYEMRGNAEEWVDDWFAPDLVKCGADCAGHNPRGPCPGKAVCKTSTRKFVKGGSWYWPGEHARSWHRRPWPPANSPPHHFGFRCAASVDQAVAIAHRAP